MRILILISLFFLSACSVNQEQANSINQKITNFSKKSSNVVATSSVGGVLINSPAENESFESKKLINSAKAETNQSETYYSVVKVVDGDTINVDIDGKVEKIRLIGINTPETVDPRKPVECFGREASQKAYDWLDGRKVSLEQDVTQENADRYGRLLRYVKRDDGLFYNLEIIKQGYAYEYTYKVPYKYQNQFKTAEANARANKFGLWATNVCP